MKTLIAPGLKSRMLGLHGWFSTNILGNRDGEVLDDPGSFKSKEETKLEALQQILQADLYPDLYKDFYHKVRINYYPPRGDAKEGWDNIDIFGWLGYPMQIKIDFLCRDSILAAPLVLDLVLFMDLAQRAGMRGIQEWLSFYFKAPMTCARVVSRARYLHPIDEAEEHAALDAGRRPDHPPRTGILRLSCLRRTQHSAPGHRTYEGSSHRRYLFIGRQLVKELCNAGHDVAVMHRKPEHGLGGASGTCGRPQRRRSGPASAG